MKYKPVDTILSVIVALIILSSCTLQTPTLPPADIHASTTSPLLTPTLAPADIHAPTIPPSPTPMSTPEVVTTPTPAHKNALTADEAYARIHDFLRNDENCRLPCWMGIVPGQSPWSDVQEQLVLYDDFAEATSFKNEGHVLGFLLIDFTPEGDRYKSRVRSDMAINYVSRTGEDTVNLIEVYMAAGIVSAPDGIIIPNEMKAGNPTFLDLFGAYFLPEVLAAFGPPDQVIVTSYVLPIEPGGDPLPGDSIAIRLHYPEAGLFFRYFITLVKRSGDNYVFCPANTFAIEMNLLSQNYTKDYKTILPTLMPIYAFEESFLLSIHDKTSEEALGMTSEEFFQYFRSSPKGCLETPTSIWPDW